MDSSAFEPEQAPIMHFTHIDNLTSIFAGGRLLADNIVGSQLTTDVGAVNIKLTRRVRPVTCPPGGVVADYVPFYFAPRSPMMYRIACEHRDGRAGCYPGGDDPLVYLVSSIDRVRTAGLSWVVSDGNCAAGLTTFSRSLVELADLVDWPLMAARYWNNVPEDPDRVRRRMAELLVHKDFPLELVAGYVVRTATRARQLRQLLRAAGIISAYVDVRPDWYYGYSREEVL
ncbi:type II toxin-antitoxin system toxin DNA ADP-ribosyl transferase DarT [Micromonospora sp. WMMA1923]|uniref:type II toxin-antitoxin system toxin DNA ADP-ribosyl transferase DarT n=1 Tax=Micromonospora sp. WMMA1923 TaxID=3404125 RepID=UPI003B95BABE